ncbi:MAG TPA: hypothetical protein VJN18_27170 [Polyangiaceae bacterium]|nr:hypothetical protein [Polyangiaceae bacterium]
MNDKTKKNALEGEGSYSGTRLYNAGLAKHVRSADVAALGKKAAEALDGAEGEALRQAEKRGKAGPRKARRPTPARQARSRAAHR